MNRSYAMAGALFLGGWLAGAAWAQDPMPDPPPGWSRPQILLNGPIVPVAHEAEADAKGKPEAKPALDMKPAVPAVAEAADCGHDCCKEKGLQGVLFGGFDGWHGNPDIIFGDNFGLHVGGNVGAGLVDRWGLGVQAGFRYIGADWDGRLIEEISAWESELFFTTGLFKRADKGLPFTAAVVVDFLITDNFGFFANEPSLHQWRVLLGKPLGDRNEVGFWGAFRDGKSEQSFDFDGSGSVLFSAVSRYNLYWRHLFASGAESMAYFGFVDDNRHGLGPGSLGTWSFGLDIQAPISDRVSLYADFAYMRPSASTTSDGIAAFENAFNVSFGVAFYPCFNLRNRCSISNRGWLPALPVGNNGTFMVDSSFGGIG